jgi:hypothetical protein
LNCLIEAWLPVTFAVNSINRSMGLHDLYPFVLRPPAIAKLAFVHERIRDHAGRRNAPERPAKMMIAGLRPQTWLLPSVVIRVPQQSGGELGLARQNIKALFSASRYRVRLYSNQPFDFTNFAFGEENVGRVECCPRGPSPRRLQITGTKAQHGPEQIRAELLKPHRLGINTFCATSDDVLYRHLPWTYAPIRHPVENKEHQHPNNKQSS